MGFFGGKLQGSLKGSLGVAKGEFQDSLQGS